MKIVFEVQGAPVGWQRAGVNRWSGRHYTQDRTRDAEMAAALAYKTAARGYRFPDGAAVAITIHAYYPIPQRTSKAKREEMIMGNLLPTVKPDVDNVSKLILDALNGVACDDDKQVVGGTAWKWYSDNPHIVVTVQDAGEFLKTAREGEE